MKHADFKKAATIQGQITSFGIVLERMEQGQTPKTFTAHLTGVPILTFELTKTQVQDKLIDKLAELKTGLMELGIEAEINPEEHL